MKAKLKCVHIRGHVHRGVFLETYVDMKQVGTSTAARIEPIAKRSKKKSMRRKNDGPLTEAELKFLKPEPKRYYEGDGQGLYIEVFPTGGKAWRYRYRLNGKPEKVVLGKYPSMSLKAAREMRNELATTVSKGLSPARHKSEARIIDAPAITLEQFGKRFYTEQIKPNWKDPQNEQRYLTKEIYPGLGAKSLQEISIADIRDLVYRKRDNGFPAAAAKMRDLIKRIYDYAMECGLTDRNPARVLKGKFIYRARARTRALSAEELRVYLEIIYRSNIRRQFKLAFHIIVLTLIRKSELLLAEWREIDFDSAQWEIPPEHAKTKEALLIPLSKQVVQMFRELKSLAGDSHLIMPGRGSSIKPFAKNALNKALEGLTFPMAPFTIHDLRRTASTRLHELGFKPDVIEKALNHKIGGIRGVYNKAEYLEERKLMLRQWADYVESLVTERGVLFQSSPALNE
jgi:integrase